jgi:hypothetical protein
MRNGWFFVTENETVGTQSIFTTAPTVIRIVFSNCNEPEAQVVVYSASLSWAWPRYTILVKPDYDVAALRL